MDLLEKSCGRAQARRQGGQLSSRDALESRQDTAKSTAGSCYNVRCSTLECCSNGSIVGRDLSHDLNGSGYVAFDTVCKGSYVDVKTLCGHSIAMIMDSLISPTLEVTVPARVVMMLPTLLMVSRFSIGAEAGAARMLPKSMKEDRMENFILLVG